MERATQQRRAIRQVLEQLKRPLGPQEVWELARPSVPGLGIATVYRNLKALVEEGWLIAVELPGEPPRYELAGKRHHHHFRCRKCARVYETHGCPGNLSNLAPAGFTLEDHHILLLGLCSACQPGPATSSKMQPVARRRFHA